MVSALVSSRLLAELEMGVIGVLAEANLAAIAALPIEHLVVSIIPLRTRFQCAYIIRATVSGD